MQTHSNISASFPQVGQPARDAGEKEGLAPQLRLFAASSVALGVYESFDRAICPPRLKVNVYRQGCGYKCSFCYVWHGRMVRPDRGILRHLPKDIELARQYDLSHLPVMVSCSTDPFQPLESSLRHTEKVLGLLAVAKFPLIILTQNPGGMLHGDYINIIKTTSSVVEVSIASRKAGPDAKDIFFTLAPASEERFRAIQALVDKGISVRLRLDPIIPRVCSEGPGQSSEDIRWLVDRASDAGVTMVISKAMVLTPEIHPQTHAQLLPFYRQNSAANSSSDVLVLNKETQRVLLTPVWQACQDVGIPFCSCVSPVSFSGSVLCRFPGTRDGSTGTAHNGALKERGR